jgi:Putative beta-barrel porin-2, OmpL-like. bbp2
MTITVLPTAPGRGRGLPRSISTVQSVVERLALENQGGSFMLGRWSTFVSTCAAIAFAAGPLFGVEFVVGDQTAGTQRGRSVPSATGRAPVNRQAGRSVAQGRPPQTSRVSYPDPSVSTPARTPRGAISPSRSMPMPRPVPPGSLRVAQNSPGNTGHAPENTMISPEAGGGAEPAINPQPMSSVPTDSSWAWDESGMNYGSGEMIPEYPDGSIGACGDSCGEWGGDCGESDDSKSKTGWFADFWISQGFTANYDRPANKFNLPLTFNDRANEYQMNQLYVSLGRKVTDCGDCWDLGGRVDLLYGTDYFFTTARGLETNEDGSPKWNGSDGPRNGGAADLYGLALPQAFAEVYIPMFTGITVKLGHFYTPVGYEGVMAPENFFYSHAYTHQYGEPFTHTGVLAQIPLSDSFGSFFGYTQGWDTFEDPNNQPGFLAGCTWNPDDSSSIAVAVHTGDEDAAGLNNRSMYSFVFSNQVTDKVKYVFQHDFGMEANAEIDLAGNLDSAKWYGINQYLYYEASQCVTLGTRVEWFRDQDNARVLGIPDEARVAGGNYFGLSFGANCKFARRFVLRPEIRYDWSDVVPPGSVGMYDGFSDDDQFTMATDLIFRF